MDRKLAIGKALRNNLFFAVSLLVLTACGGDNNQQTNEDNDPGRPVKIYQITDIDNLSGSNYPGRVEAFKRVELAFQVSGPLVERNIHEGQEVPKGYVLARIDPRDFQHRYNEEKAKLVHASKEYIRYKTLLDRSVVPQSEVDAKEAAFKIAQAKTDTAEKALKDTNLYAPFAGVVAKTYVENHENVRAKEPILSLQDVSQIEIVTNIPEQVIFHLEKQVDDGKLPTHSVGSVVFDSYTQKHYPVYVKEYSTQADTTTQTYRVTLKMTPPKEFNVLPGMSLKVYPDFGNESLNDIRVPISALITHDDGKQYVWVIDQETMRTQPVEVQAGKMYDNMIAIKSGLKPGQQVVTAGVNDIKPDMKVRILKHEDMD